MGGARGVVFGAPVAAPFGRRTRGGTVPETWPSLGGRLLYATLGWLAPAAALTMGPIGFPVPIVSAVLSALAVALLLAPRPAYFAAVGGTAALVAGAGLALGEAASGGTLGFAFDTLASAIVVMVYVGAVILAWLDWPIPRPWAEQP